MSAAGLELAEALATIALLHEELAEAKKDRDSYQRLWHLAKEELAQRDEELDAARRANESPNYGRGDILS